MGGLAIELDGHRTLLKWHRLGADDRLSLSGNPRGSGNRTPSGSTSVRVYFSDSSNWLVHWRRRADRHGEHE